MEHIINSHYSAMHDDLSLLKHTILTDHDGMFASQLIIAYKRMFSMQHFPLSFFTILHPASPAQLLISSGGRLDYHL